MGSERAKLDVVEAASLAFESDALVVLVGAAGSGKSTWATRFDNGVVSTDACRALTGENQRDIRASTDAFAIVADIVERRLRRGLFTLVDSTGLDVEQRERWVAAAVQHERPVHTVVFDVPLGRCKEQNRHRADPVPQRVVESQTRTVRDLLDAATPVIPEAATETVIRPEQRIDATVQAVTPSTVDDAPATSAGGSLGDRPRIGLQISDISRGTDGDRGFAAVVDWAAEAESVGVDSIWLMDHLLQIPQVGRRWDPILDPVTALAAIASATTTVELGVLVSPVTWHHPVLLAKRLATLDVVSGGRAVCGLGLGWFADEHDAFGFPLPPASARYERLVDLIGALRALWGPGSKPFEGVGFRLADTTAYPRPVQGTIPIIVGGSGPTKTLKVAAEHADGCNLFGDLDRVRTLVEIHHGHAEAAGVEPGDRRVTHLASMLAADTAAALDAALDRVTPPRRSRTTVARQVGAGLVPDQVARLRRLAAVGVDEVIVTLPDLGLPGAIERLGAVIAAFDE